MPDIPDRDELERKLARALGSLNKAQLARLIEYMGDPPDVNKVPPEFWREAGEELAAVVVPFSERVYLDAAERMLENISVGVDWDLVNIAASSWARDYGYNLVTGINQTSRQAISSAVDAYFQQGLTQGQLQDRLSRIYSPVRSEMIARTEVTRAAAQGERAFVQEIRKQGIEMVEVWQTRNDEVVCPICGPRNGKKRGDGWDSDNEPPAHPRCRCWINHEIVRQVLEALTGASSGLTSHEQILANAARSIGFNPEKVLFPRKDGFDFVIGGQPSRAAGAYYPDEGVIRIFKNAYDNDWTTEKGLNGLMAHEIQHDRYNTWQKLLSSDNAEIQRLMRSIDDDKLWPITYSGELREGYKGRFKAYELQKEMMEDMNMLQEIGGVSNYSNRYWADAAERKVSQWTAVNETFAEIARLKMDGLYHQVPPIWREYYEKVSEITRTP